MTDNGVHPLKASRLSLSAQAREYLLDLIENGTYEPGQQLPSENELAAQLGISRPTLREALLNLEQERAIIRRHGVGTFVAPRYGRLLESGLERLESILELAARREMLVDVANLEVSQRPASPDLADTLQVPPGTPLTFVDRVLVVDSRPVAYMSDATLASVLSPSDVESSFSGSVLDLLKQKPELQFGQAVADIVAINADPFLCRKLRIKPQQALLLLEETLFDDQGVAVEYSRNYFVPEFFRFHVVRR